MVEIFSSDEFNAWLAGLKDIAGQGRINVRIKRLAAGNPGDVKPVGEGISEMKIDFGPGYRVYFKQKGRLVAILLAGGDKSTQDRDIVRAKALAKDWESIT